MSNMSSPDKDECNCGQLARLAEDPRNSIQFDVQLNEYHIIRKDGTGYSLIHFCPICGGRAPKSQRNKLSQSKARLFQQTHEVHMTPNPPPSPSDQGPQIDTSKRYDVYCHEPVRGVVVYRNALFKGTGLLLPSPRGRSTPQDYVELEQANGQTIFLTRHSIFRFCAPGTAIVAEAVPKTEPDGRKD
jgi:hypothetical protein